MPGLGTRSRVKVLGQPMVWVGKSMLSSSLGPVLVPSSVPHREQGQVCMLGSVGEKGQGWGRGRRLGGGLTMDGASRALGASCELQGWRGHCLLEGRSEEFGALLLVPRDLQW